MKTVIFKLTQVEQYDPASQTINWQDATPKRWERIYNTLVPGNRAFFIGQNKVYSGILTGRATPPLKKPSTLL
ncbi:MAG TPA: hypothetical protein VGC22_02510 [Chitinophaga sp.]